VVVLVVVVMPAVVAMVFWCGGGGVGGVGGGVGSCSPSPKQLCDAGISLADSGSPLLCWSVFLTSFLP
jgi:hypothetical protein